MTEAQLVLALEDAGLTIGTNGRRLSVQPEALLSRELRALVSRHKAGLMVMARNAERRTAHAMLSAMLSSVEEHRLLRGMQHADIRSEARP